MQNTTGLANISLSLNDGLAAKAFLSMTPCFFFLYINGVMLFTLRSKEVFCETPRYILFSGLLFSDSLQLLLTIVFYILHHSVFDEASLYIVSYFCYFIYLCCRIINIISPLYLAFMSLERYVAICFPLQHAQIANKKRAFVAVTIVWILGLIFWTAELTVSMTFKAHSPTRQSTCSDFIISQTLISYNINMAFTIVIFASVSVVIIFTYIAILVTAKSATSEKTPASKAHRTVLLHMVQFCLYLLSILFGMIRRALAMSKLPPFVIKQLVYVLFILANIFPRCLSPLIYGLRDKTFSAFFKYKCLFCLRGKVQSSTFAI